MDIQDAKGSQSETPKKQGTFGVGVLSVAAALLALGVALIPLLAPAPGDGLELTPWQEVAGNLHFVTLHIPIGIFVLVFTMEFLGLLSFGKYKPRIALPLLFGVCFAVLAVIQGYLLYLQEGKPDALITRHMWGSIAFTGLGALTYVSKIWGLRAGVKSPVYGVLLTLTMVAMTLAGHWGGESVHGDPFNPLKEAEEAKSKEPIKLAGDDGSGGEVVAVTTKAPEEQLAYEEVVVPILESKCYRCHSKAKKKRGGLLMDSYEALLEGGNEGPALVPGDLEKSLMIKFIHIPIDDDPDDLHMPPAGKPQLTEDEIAILDWWVKTGAPQGKTLKEAGAPAAILTSVSTLVPPAIVEKATDDEKAMKEKEKAEAADRKATLKKTVDALSEQFMGALSFVSYDSEDLVFSAVGIRKDFNDDGLKTLMPVGSSIKEINLSGTAVTDSGLAYLQAMPHLRKLRLNDTAITDQSLEGLASLAELEFLVLFGTDITDAGLEKLSGATSLKQLYVGATKVTESGVKALQENLPELEINTGI